MKKDCKFLARTKEKVYLVVMKGTKNTPMTSNQVKAAIKAKAEYDIDFLNTLANRSGIQLMTVNFWWNAIKN